MEKVRSKSPNREAAVKVIGFIPEEMLQKMERNEVEYKRRKITRRVNKSLKRGVEKQESRGRRELTHKPFQAALQSCVDRVK